MVAVTLLLEGQRWLDEYELEELEYWRPMVAMIRNERWRRKTSMRPPLPYGIRAHLLHKYDSCLACGATDRLEIDHIIPYSKGGTHEISNLQVLCKQCNLSKGNRSSTDYR